MEWNYTGRGVKSEFSVAARTVSFSQRKIAVELSGRVIGKASA